MKVSQKAWTRWQSVIQKLWKDFEFPANTRDSLSGYFSLFRGEGSCFRLDTESWKMALDVLRTGDEIIDIVAITLASNLAPESKVRGGWVITTRCPIHPHPKHPSQKSPAKNPSEKSDLFWYKIEEGGKVSTHCCNQECAGPFRPSTWKIFDSVRQGIVIKTLEHEVLQLRSPDNSSKLKEKEKGESELKAQIASINREKMELQVKYDTMNGSHTEQAHDLIEIRAEHRDLVAELSETKAKLAAMRTLNDEMRNDLEQANGKSHKSDSAFGRMRKQVDATTKRESALKVRLHEALQEMKVIRGNHHAAAGSSSQQKTGTQEAATSTASNYSLVSSGNARRSQSLAIRSRPRIDVVDLTSEVGPAESPSKGPGLSQKGVESETEVAGQPSSSKKDRRKRKRDAQSVPPNDEDEDDTPSKRRSSKGRRHGPKIKAEPEA
jgi:hypothetical protein